MRETDAGGFGLQAIGRVSREDGDVRIQIHETYRPALHQLDQFSHVLVLWWADRHDNEKSRRILRTQPPYAPTHTHGVFATRAEYRPNPIAVTVCRILAVDEAAGVVQVSNIDAIDGTPVVDLKAYYPVCDRVRSASVPAWLIGWPEWFPEEGLEP